MIHAWPKGRVIRTILAAAAIGIGIDFGWDAYGKYQAWSNAGDTEGIWAALVTFIVFTICAVAAFFGGLYAVLIKKRSADFLIEVEREMTRVTWPGRADVIRSTIVIAVITVIMALLIFAVDWINRWLVYDNILAPTFNQVS